jgi:hypothetical protein
MPTSIEYHVRFSIPFQIKSASLLVFEIISRYINSMNFMKNERQINYDNYLFYRMLTPEILVINSFPKAEGVTKPLSFGFDSIFLIKFNKQFIVKI